MINFGMLNTNTNPMGDMLRGSQMSTELKKAQNQYNVQDALYQLSQKPNPTYQDYEGIMNNYPQLAEVVKAPMANIDEKRRRVAEQNFAPVMAAAQNGRLDYVGDLLKKQEEAYINSGDSENAQAVQTMRKMFELDPAVGKTMLGLMGMAVSPTTMKSIFAQSELDTQNLKNTAQAGQALAAARKADIEAQYIPAQTQAEIEAKGAGAYAARTRGDFDAAQMADMPIKRQQEAEKAAQVPEFALKIINDNSAAATKALDDKNNMDAAISLLQKNIDSMGSNLLSASGNSWAEWWNKLGPTLGGNTTVDYDTVRQEYKKARNSEIVRSLPPGPATDRDIALFAEGFPPTDASPMHMMSFMRGFSKVKQIEAQVSELNADWARQNRGSLGRADRDIDINGMIIAKGTSRNDAIKQLVAKGSRVQAATGFDAGKEMQNSTNRALVPNLGQEVSGETAAAFAKHMRDNFGYGD